MESHSNNSKINIDFRMGPYLVQISTSIFIVLFYFWTVLIVVGRYDLHGNTVCR